MLRLSLTEFISWHPCSGSAGQSIWRLEMVWRSRQPTRKQQSYRVVSECLLPFKTHTNDTLLLWPALGSPGASSDPLCRKLRESGHAVPSLSHLLAMMVSTKRQQRQTASSKQWTRGSTARENLWTWQCPKTTTCAPSNQHRYILIRYLASFS